MADFVVNNSDDKTVIAAIEQLNVGVGKFEWSCKLCGKGSADDHRLDSFECGSGHRFATCFRTLLPCDEFVLEECVWCRAVTLPEGSKFSIFCIFCSGPIS